MTTLESVRPAGPSPKSRPLDSNSVIPPSRIGGRNFALARPAGVVRGLAVAAIATAFGLPGVSADDSPSTLRAEQQNASGGGVVSDLSPWGQAGLMWTQAQYTKKLTEAALASDPTAAQAEALEALQSTTRRDIEALEQFGWKRLRKQRSRESDVASDRQRNQQIDESSKGGNRVPSPEEVGEALAKDLGLEASSSSGSQNEPSDVVADPSSPTPTTVGIERMESERPLTVFDTETPAGTEDPGINDELDEDLEAFDVSHYRVDDVVDETDAERANIADAIEDGAEMALAAGVDTIGGSRGGYISLREAQTLSSSLPYAVDSIYDADDYDPDVDYDIDNPAGKYPNDTSGLAAVRQGYDGRDDIDNEDELSEAYLGADRTNAPKLNAVEANRVKEPIINELAADAGASRYTRGEDATSDAATRDDDRVVRLRPNMDKETRSDSMRTATGQTPNREPSVARSDAQWVQMQLSAYQTRWDMLSSADNPASLDKLLRHLDVARTERAATAATVAKNTAHPKLAQLAERITERNR